MPFDLMSLRMAGQLQLLGIVISEKHITSPLVESGTLHKKLRADSTYFEIEQHQHSAHLQTIQ